jgi:hypothetical protein
MLELHCGDVAVGSDAQADHGLIGSVERLVLGLREERLPLGFMAERVGLM